MNIVMNIVEFSEAYGNWKKEIAEQLERQEKIKQEIFSINLKLGFDYTSNIKEVIKNVISTGSYYTEHVLNLVELYFKIEGEYKAAIIFENELIKI